MAKYRNKSIFATATRLFDGIRDRIYFVSPCNPHHDFLALDSMHDLMQLDCLSDGLQVSVAGFHTANDGGGGIFRWSGSTSKQNHDGGTYIDPDKATSLANWNTMQEEWYQSANGLENGVWRRIYDGAINIRWFGATPMKASHDPLIVYNETAIGMAILACSRQGGGIVLYPAGTYGISSAIICHRDVPITHLGQGENTIIKALASHDNNPQAFNLFKVTSSRPQVFANFTLDGSCDEFSAHPRLFEGNGIYFNANVDPGEADIAHRGNVVRNVRFINHYSCGVCSFGDKREPLELQPLNPEEPFNPLEPRHPEDPLWSPLDKKRVHEIVVHNCSFASIGRMGLYFRYLTHGGVWDCDIDFSGGEKAGIAFAACKDFIIARNSIANGCTGISVGASDNYSITDNSVRDTLGTGIVASGAAGTLNPNNSSAYANKMAYHMSRRFVCTGNRVYNAGAIGITVDPHYRFCVEPSYCDGLKESVEHGDDTLVLCEDLTHVKLDNDVPVEQWGIVAHNLVHSTKNNGISINYSKHMLIQDNMVIGAGINGINLGSSSHCTVIGNHIVEWGNWAIGSNMDCCIPKECPCKTGNDKICYKPVEGCKVSEEEPRFCTYRTKGTTSFGHYYIGENAVIGDGIEGRFQVENEWSRRSIPSDCEEPQSECDEPPSNGEEPPSEEGKPWMLGNETYINRYSRQTVFNTIPDEEVTVSSVDEIIRLPPACSELRGEIYLVSPGPGESDQLYVCKKQVYVSKEQEVIDYKWVKINTTT